MSRHCCYRVGKPTDGVPRSLRELLLGLYSWVHRSRNYEVFIGGNDANGEPPHEIGIRQAVEAESAKPFIKVMTGNGQKLRDALETADLMLDEPPSMVRIAESAIAGAALVCVMVSSQGGLIHDPAADSPNFTNAQYYRTRILLVYLPKNYLRPSFVISSAKVLVPMKSTNASRTNLHPPNLHA